MEQTTYVRIKENGKKEIFDPIRKKYVAFTPEEEVRQKVIHLLHQILGIPWGSIGVENGGVVYGRRFRTDIKVIDRRGRTVWIIECKRGEKSLGPEVVEQMERYDLGTDARFCMMTNGSEFYCWEKKKDPPGWVLRKSMPFWSEILEEKV